MKTCALYELIINAIDKQRVQITKNMIEHLQQSIDLNIDLSVLQDSRSTHEATESDNGRVTIIEWIANI